MVALTITGVVAVEAADVEAAVAEDAVAAVEAVVNQ